MLTSARSTALPCETVRKSTAMSAKVIPAACCSRMHCRTAASSSLSVRHSTICAPPYNFFSDNLINNTLYLLYSALNR